MMLKLVIAGFLTFPKEKCLSKITPKLEESQKVSKLSAILWAITAGLIDP